MKIIIIIITIMQNVNINLELDHFENFRVELKVKE